jgi:hypothetical protein
VSLRLGHSVVQLLLTGNKADLNGGGTAPCRAAYFTYPFNQEAENSNLRWT